ISVAGGKRQVECGRAPSCVNCAFGHHRPPRERTGEGMISPPGPEPTQIDSERFLEALALERQVETAHTNRLASWFERAAVLAWFEPHMVGAPVDLEDLLEDEDWIALIADSEIARTAQDGPRRRLKLAKRREALAGLEGRDGFKKALSETKD